jgi:hypothetical protein
MLKVRIFDWIRTVEKKILILIEKVKSITDYYLKGCMKGGF